MRAPTRIDRSASERYRGRSLRRVIVTCRGRRPRRPTVYLPAQGSQKWGYRYGGEAPVHPSPSRAARFRSCACPVTGGGWGWVFVRSAFPTPRGNFYSLICGRLLNAPTFLPLKPDHQQVNHREQQQVRRVVDIEKPHAPRALFARAVVQQQ